MKDRKLSSLAKFISTLLLLSNIAFAQSTADTVALSQQLQKTEYESLQSWQPSSKLDSLMQTFGANSFEMILSDTNQSARLRFFSAEVLRQKQAASLQTMDDRVLMKLYAQALAGNFTGGGNAWGLPDPRGPIEDLALFILRKKEAAVPAFTALLENEADVHYWGSEEATIGYQYKFRVKDIAYWYLTRIRKEEFQLDRSPAARDKIITAFKKKMG